MHPLKSEKSSRHPAHVFIAITAVITLSLGFFLRDTFAAGTFGTASSFISPSPSVIALGDFNGDGLTDMAVAVASSGGDVQIFLGDGHGNFAPPVGGPAAITFAVSSGIQGLISVDLGNGHQDLVATLTGTDQIGVMLGDGAGHFAPPPSSPEYFNTGPNPTGIVSGDFNGDGAIDLAVTVGSGVDVFTGIPSTPGDFNPSVIDSTSGPNPAGIITTDFNGDGKLDLLVTDMGNNTVTAMRGDGLGSFPIVSTEHVGTGPWSLAAADFNGDGNIDYAVTSLAGNDIGIFLGDGLGNFNPPGGGVPATVPVGTGPRSITTADFGNGHADLAIVNQVDNSVSILMGDGHGNFTPAIPAVMAVGNNPQDIVTGDFDGDGAPDLATADLAGNDVSVLLDGTAVTNVTSTTPDGTYGAGTVIPIQVTFNKLVIVDTTGGSPTLLINTGVGPVPVPFTGGSGTNTLTFTYTVSSGDASPDLDYASSSALLLNGATIEDASSRAASLTLADPGTTGSLGSNKNIVIDTVVPVVEPVLTETVPVPTPTIDTSPSYTFTSDEAGTLTYMPSSGCGTTATTVTAGSNTITLVSATTLLPLSPGTYSCSFSVTDGSSNTNVLNATPFTVIATGGGGGTTGGGTTGAAYHHNGHVFTLALREITPVPATTTNASPSYTFSSNESGTISYGGGCTSPVTYAVNGSNTITLSPLSGGSYSSCTVTVTDLLGRTTTMSMSPFTVSVPAPAPKPAPAPSSAPSYQNSTPPPAPVSVSRPVNLATPNETAPIQNVTPPAVPAPFVVPGTEAAPGAPAQAAVPAVTAPTIATPVAPAPVQTQLPSAQTPTQPMQVFGTEPNNFIPAGQGVPAAAQNSAASSQPAIPDQPNSCSTGTSTGFLGTIGDMLKWGVCSAGAGIAKIL